MRETYENSAEYREVSQMTRSEYLKEYADIIEHFDEEKKTLKKLLPFCIILSVINILVVIGLIIIVVPIIYDNLMDNDYINLREIERIITSLVMPCVLSFPLVSIKTRFKQIKKKENERLQDLEDRKNLCIEIGTYNAEE